MSAAVATQVRKDRFEISTGRDDGGQWIFSVLVKRTYDLLTGVPLKRAEEDRPLQKVDAYWEMGDAQTSTVQFEGELTPFKKLTDIVFIGKVMSPGGKPVAQMDVGIQVEGLATKVIRVIGDRHCLHRNGAAPQFTDPKPFTEIDLRYDFAYGGKDVVSDPSQPFEYPRNGRGRGFAIQNLKDQIHEMPLPNFEDPLDLLTPDRIVLEDVENWVRQPMAMGLGYYPRTCYPRSFFAGAIPPHILTGTVTREELMGFVQENHIALARGLKFPSFQSHFMQGASPGLFVPRLKGTETLKLRGLTAEGLLTFALPGDAPAMSADFGKGCQDLEAVLDTVCIRGQDRQVDMIWRGSLTYPDLDWMASSTKMEVEVS
jgi:hypothetical protein